MRNDTLRLRLTWPFLAILLAATAIPVELRSEAAALSFNVYASDVLLNILVYVPVGMALSGFGAWAAIGGALLMSAGSEALQIFAVHRHASPIDIGSNVTGAVIGVLASRYWHIGAPWIRVSRRSGALGAIALLALAGAALSSGDPSFRDWDSGAVLAVGDELTGDRPWHGDIIELAIVADALDARTIRNIAQQGSFSGLPAPPAFGPVRGLNVEEIRGKPLLPPAGLDALYDRLTAQSALSVLLRFRTEDVRQTGARIVIYSGDRRVPNFALAQYGRRVTFRVRTPRSAENNAAPSLSTGSVLRTGQDVFVAATFDGFISRIFVNGRLRGRANLGAAAKAAPVLGDVLFPAFAVALGALAALSAAGLFQPRKRSLRWIACLAGAAAGGLLLILSGGASSLPSFEPWVLPLTLAGGSAVGLGLAAALHTDPV